MAGIKFKIKGLSRLISSLDRFKKQYVTYSRSFLEEFSYKVSYEAQKNMRIRAGFLGKPPWYRNKNTGKHLRIASGKLRDSLYSIYQKKPNQDAVYSLDTNESSVSVLFGTKAMSDGWFGYPSFHENGRFPFLLDKATYDLLEYFMVRKLGILRF